MAADPVFVRLARLEGSYEQMDNRMADLHAELRATRSELGNRIDQLGGRIDHVSTQLSARIDHVSSRVDMVLYGVAVAILVPIFLRVFFR